MGCPWKVGSCELFWNLRGLFFAFVFVIDTKGTISVCSFPKNESLSLIIEENNHAQDKID